MNNEIEKPEQPNPDDVLAAITSFNDVSIITNIFKELGWSYSLEIRETIIMAKQNSNLSIKFKALKHLRELLREAAEASGYTANVSTTIPNAQGGQTTFSAKRISGILNPVKKIESTEIKEPENDKKEETRTQPNRGSDRGQNKAEGTRPENEISTRHSDIRPDSSKPIRDTRRAFPAGDVESGGTEPPDGGETPRPVPGDRDPSQGGNNDSVENSDSGIDSGNTSPCITTRPPTCDQDLFPGISSAED